MKLTVSKIIRTQHSLCYINTLNSVTVFVADNSITAQNTIHQLHAKLAVCI